MFIFMFVTSSWNMSLQYVNAKICTLRLGLGVHGGWVSGVAPMIHYMLGHSLTRHLHLER